MAFLASLAFAIGGLQTSRDDFSGQLIDVVHSVRIAAAAAAFEEIIN